MTIKIRRRASGATFIHPMDPTPRTAVLTPGFQESKLVRVYTKGWSAGTARFNPSSLAGSVEQLRHAIGQDLHLRHAVIVFTYGGRAGFSDDDRDLFWDSFGVPIFEQRLGPGNKLLAMECDAHAGLHVISDFENIRLDRSKCVCGNPTPRLPKRARIEELADMLA
jgi:hypothetical protein